MYQPTLLGLGQRIFALSLIFSILTLLIPAQFVQAAPGINKQIPFDGSLKTSAGAAVSDGSYDMVFKIYDAATAGATLWTGTHTAGNSNAVGVADGIFRVMLGSGTGNSLAGIDFNDDSYYVGLAVEGDSEMTPRYRLGAAGYAFNSDTLDGLDSTDFISTSTSQQVTFSNGLGIASSTPSVTTSTLYNLGNVLYWNGSAVGVGGGATTLNALTDVSAAAVNGSLLYFNGTTWDDLATSSLAINTDDLVEGSALFWTQARFAAALAATSTTALSEGTNLYYTAARVNALITASTSISQLGQSIDLGTETTGTLASTSLAGEVLVDSELNTESELEALLGDVTNVFTNNDGALNDDDLSNNDTDDLSEGSNLYFTTDRASTTALAVLAATTTDALAEGSNNLYWTNARFDTRLSATTTLPGLTILAGLTTIGQTGATTTVAGNLEVDEGIYLTSNTPVDTTNALYNNAGSLYWNGSDISTPPGGTITTVNQSSSFTAAVNTSYQVDTSGPEIVVTLPTGGVDGDVVRIEDATGNFAATSTLVLPGSGDTVEGSTATTTLATSNTVTTFIYDADNNRWTIQGDNEEASTVLHYASLGIATAGGGNIISLIATTIGAGYSALDLDDTGFDISYDPHGMITTADNSFTIKQAGLYEIAYSLTSSGASNDYEIRVDGAIAGVSRIGVANAGFTIQTIQTLAVGQKIEFKSPSNALGVSITVKQLPTAVITAQAQAAEYLQVTLSANQTSNFLTSDQVEFNSTLANSGSNISTDSNGVFTLTAGKTYKLNGYVLTGYSSSNEAAYRWFNVTEGASIGSSHSGTSVNLGIGESTGGIAMAIITPSVDTVMELRPINTTNVNGYSATDSWALIETIADGTMVQELGGATASTTGTLGFIAGADAGYQGALLLGDGNWLNPDHFNVASTTATRISIGSSTLAYNELNLQGALYIASSTSAIATTTQSLYAVGSDLYWNGSAIGSGGGGGGLTTANQATSFTATANTSYQIDSTSAQITVTLPTGGADGDKVEIIDAKGNFAATSTLVLPGGAETVEGSTGTTTLATSNTVTTFIYDADNTNWIIKGDNEEASTVLHYASAYSQTDVIVGDSKVNFAAGDIQSFLGLTLDDANDEFDIQQAGTYEIIFNATYQDSSEGQVISQIRQNGSIVLAEGYSRSIEVSGVGDQSKDGNSVVAIAELAAGDTIDIYQDVTGSPARLVYNFTIKQLPTAVITAQAQALERAIITTSANIVFSGAAADMTGWNEIDASGSNISLSAGQITLQPGRRYVVKGYFGMDGDPNTNVANQVGWTLPGGTSITDGLHHVKHAWLNNQAETAIGTSDQPIALLEVTPTSPLTFVLRQFDVSTDNHAIAAGSSWIEIEVIADGTYVQELAGASEASAGTLGFVAGAEAGEQGSVLLGDGNWSATSTLFLNASGTLALGAHEEITGGNSSNIADNSLVIGNGAFCVDNGGLNCDDGARVAGTIYANNTTVTSVDLAENYPSNDSTLLPGELVVIDSEAPSHIKRAETTDEMLLGIISTKPGILLGGYGDHEFEGLHRAPVALAGRVPVLFSSENGAVEPGDKLIMSITKSGYAMAACGSVFCGDARSIGIALEAFTEDMSGDTDLVAAELVEEAEEIEEAIEDAEATTELLEATAEAIDEEITEIVEEGGSLEELSELSAAAEEVEEELEEAEAIEEEVVALETVVETITDEITEATGEGRLMVFVELSDVSGEVEASEDFLSFLGEAAEKVGDFVKNQVSAMVGFFDTLFAREVHTETLCIGSDGDETCITQEQLNQLLDDSDVEAVVVEMPIVPEATEVDEPETEVDDEVVEETETNVDTVEDEEEMAEVVAEATEEEIEVVDEEVTEELVEEVELTTEAQIEEVVTEPESEQFDDGVSTEPVV